MLQKKAVPVITNEEEARRRPELGVLSVMAHGDTEEAAAIAAAVLPAVHDLDDERVRFYTDLVYNSLNDAARKALETMMKGYEYQSDFAKNYIAQERAASVLDLLQDRGLDVPEAVRERVLAQKDPAVLRRWFRRAVTVSSAAEIFDDPS
ncbi:MAG: hypothetical protein U0441_01015 [Polyangiaceae bacterium]